MHRVEALHVMHQRGQQLLIEPLSRRLKDPAVESLGVRALRDVLRLSRSQLSVEKANMYLAVTLVLRCA